MENGEAAIHLSIPDTEIKWQVRFDSVVIKRLMARKGGGREQAIRYLAAEIKDTLGLLLDEFVPGTK
jgi:hypothetical protein